MTDWSLPPVDRHVQTLRDIRAILERARREQNMDKVKREIEQAIERINSEL